jgi:hypothetical protein
MCRGEREREYVYMECFGDRVMKGYVFLKSCRFFSVLRDAVYLYNYSTGSVMRRIL